MKNKIAINIKAQSSSNVTEFKVIYKPNTQQSGNGISNILCVPSITIATSNIGEYSKVYFKIIDNNTKSIIHQANYLLESSEMLDANNNLLFKRVNQNIILSNGNAIMLKPYLYEIYFESSQGNKSVVYTKVN
jgi:hypothetical protein